MKSSAAPLFIALAGGLLAAPAGAAGPYDGTWVIDAPQAGGTGTGATGGVETGCEALRFEVQIVDNRVVGHLRRNPYGPDRVETGRGPGSAPVTGTVGNDGTLTAQWAGYKATGKLTGNQAEVRWRGECGTRVAMGSRVGSSSNGAGSSRP